MIRRVLLVALVLGASADLAAGQNSTSQNPAATAPAVEFLPDYDFHLNMEHLSHDNPRYVWDTNFGGELGIIGYGSTRLTFVANYQAILGEEFHPFDPNQGNYILEGDLTTLIDGVEVGGVFYHQSRHLADRPKRQPVDWNMFGGRVRKRFGSDASWLDARADLRGTILRTYVDYRWELDCGVTARHEVRRAVALVGTVNLRRLGVDGSRNRGTQTGFRGEGGMRFTGRAAAIELFLAVERRIDPYPLEFGTETWTGVGMRLLSR